MRLVLIIMVVVTLAGCAENTPTGGYNPNIYFTVEEVEEAPSTVLGYWHDWDKPITTSYKGSLSGWIKRHEMLLNERSDEIREIESRVDKLASAFLGMSKLIKVVWDGEKWIEYDKWPKEMSHLLSGEGDLELISKGHGGSEVGDVYWMQIMKGGNDDINEGGQNGKDTARVNRKVGRTRY